MSDKSISQLLASYELTVADALADGIANIAIPVYNSTEALQGNQNMAMRLSALFAAIEPKTVTLTDAATIAIDADTVRKGIVTLGGNRMLGNPTGTPYDEQLFFLPQSFSCSLAGVGGFSM